MNILIFIGLFLVTNQSLYFKELGINPFVLIGVVIILSLALWPRCAMIKVSTKLTLITLIFFTFYGLAVYLITRSFSSLASGVVMLFFIWSFINLISRYPRKVEHAVEATIVAHCAFFLFQVVYFFMFHEYFDFLNYLVGYEQSYMSSKGISYGDLRVPRFTGLFNEPGTFSVIISSLIYSSYIFKKKISYITFLGILCIMISFSAYGFFLVSSFILFTQIRTVRRNPFKVILFLTPVLLAAIILFYQRLTSEHSELDFRINSILLMFDLKILFLGAIGNNVNPVSNDISAPLHLILIGGIFLLAVFIFLLHQFKAFNSIEASVLVFFMLATKVKFTYPPLWILLSVVYASETYFLQRKKKVICNFDRRGVHASVKNQVMK
jgi:ABC-type multidrug transport system fused ATPase/permease subunit